MEGKNTFAVAGPVHNADLRQRDPLTLKMSPSSSYKVVVEFTQGVIHHEIERSFTSRSTPAVIYNTEWPHLSRAAAHTTRIITQCHVTIGANHGRILVSAAT